jgi:ribonuclease Z
VDFGPGVVRRAAAASTEYGGTVEGLAVDKLEIAFLTHLHHDHSAGLPDLVYTSWTHGREKPLELYGPAGIKAMAEHVAAAWEEDNRYRLYGLEPAAPDGWKINAHEIDEGVVYRDERVTVDAFKVKHGTWPNAFGYRFTTPDKVIVISGDAAYDPTIEKMATGADILIHEVVSEQAVNARDPFWQNYHRSNHTTSYELAALASRAKPGLLILYHVLVFGLEDDIVLEEVKARYDGNVVLAEDLDIFE